MKKPNPKQQQTRMNRAGKVQHKLRRKKLVRALKMRKSTNPPEEARK